MFNKISETLGIDNDIIVSDNLPIAAENMDQSAIEKANDDFEFARNKIKDAIEKTSDFLEDMVELARATEHPKAYETASGIAANIAAMADSLVKLHKETLKAQPKEPATVNNTLIVNSTDAIIKMLRSNKTIPLE